MKRILSIVIFVLGNSLALIQTAGAATTHVVTFFENPTIANPVEAFQVSATSTPLTSVSNLNPPFSNPGFVFSNWNTASNGSGATYQNGQTYSFASDLTLYAQWIPAFRTVAFCENRSTTDSRCALQSKNAPSPLTLFSTLSPALSNPGYSFSNWNTKANGSGVRYTNGQTYSFAADLTLYAQWVKSAAALNFVGTVSNSPSLGQLNHVAVQILNNHFHQVQVVQFRHQNGAVVLGLLTKLLVQHDGPSITVALRRSDAEATSPGVEIFAN